MVVNKQELQHKYTDSYIIQPFMDFESEVHFYYIKDKLEYVLEFVPSKVSNYPEAAKYISTESEIKMTDKFSK